MVKSWTGIESSKMDGEWLKGEKRTLEYGWAVRRGNAERWKGQKEYQMKMSGCLERGELSG